MNIICMSMCLFFKRTLNNLIFMHYIDLSGVEKEKVDTSVVTSQEEKLEGEKDTEESKDTHGDEPAESGTHEDVTKPSSDDTESGEIVQTPDVTPTKGKCNMSSRFMTTDLEH